ncbi:MULTISPECIES: hypothetical protein [unclassified Bradyrhizobium]
MRTFAEDGADFRDRAGAEGDADTLHALSKTAPFSHFADAISVLVEPETEKHGVRAAQVLTMVPPPELARIRKELARVNASAFA